MPNRLACLGALVVGEITLARCLARLAHRRAGEFAAALRVLGGPSIRQVRLRLTKQRAGRQGKCAIHQRHCALALVAVCSTGDGHLGRAVSGGAGVLPLPVWVDLGLCCPQVSFGVSQGVR